MPRTRLLRHVIFLSLTTFVALAPLVVPTALASLERSSQSDDAAPSRSGDSSDATASAPPNPPVAPLYLAGRPW